MTMSSGSLSLHRAGQDIPQDSNKAGMGVPGGREVSAIMVKLAPVASVFSSFCFYKDPKTEQGLEYLIPYYMAIT